MPIRITGMNSGLDTESIISELVKAKSAKKDSLVKAQTKLQWKQDAWKELNTKVYSLYSKTLSNMRLQSDYLKKTTKVSNESAATVITGANAVNGVQTLKIDQLAKTGYLTGGKLEKDKNGNAVSGATKLTDLGVAENSQIRLTTEGKTTNITVDGDMTINDFVSKVKSAGLNASFDEKNQRFFISSKESGEEADFSLTAKDAAGLNALNALGLSNSQEYLKYCKAEKVNGEYVRKDDAELQSVIDAEVQNRLSQYVENVKAWDAAQEKINKLDEKYNSDSTLGTQDKIEALESELIEKEKELDAETDDAVKKTLNEEIEKLRTEIADNKEFKSLTEERDKLQAAIDADSDNFVANGDSYEATDKLKDTVKGEILAEAQFAADVLNGKAGNVSSGATRIAGQDAKILLNGAEFSAESNTFEINGLTITANAETEEEFTITTSDDTDGIYDMIKNFFKEYNTLINEMDSLYNADSSKGYEPLTDEEKEAMSEKEIEKWEEKIKDSILRKDSTLSSVASAMKDIMLKGVTMSDGTQMYLTDFGINTLGYFNAADNERNAYHIDGDPDDTNTSGNADKLKTAIANNSEQVVEFFTTLSRNLYEKLGDMMKKTDYSSSFTLYDDIAMKEEYDDYTSKISEQEKKITAFEDRYYKKFSAMETALAKLSSKESAISGLLGM